MACRPATCAFPATFARMLLPMAGLVSLYFLLRGHNAPGGGFVGGLVMATAIIVQYMTSGVLWVESRLRIHPQYWIAIGLLSAGVAGLIAWFARAPFLTSIEWHLHLPLLGELHLSTVLLFDLGVYMVVVGAHGADAGRDRAPVAAACARRNRASRLETRVIESRASKELEA